MPPKITADRIRRRGSPNEENPNKTPHLTGVQLLVSQPSTYIRRPQMGSAFDKKMKRFCAGMIRSASTCLGRPVGYFPRYLGTNTAHAGLGSKNPHLHTTFPGRYRFSHIGVDLAAPGRCPDMMRRNTEDHEIRLGPKLRAFNPATKRIFWQVASIDFA